jgi:signal transduction histidine kinase
LGSVLTIDTRRTPARNIRRQNARTATEIDRPEILQIRDKSAPLAWLFWLSLVAISGMPNPDRHRKPKFFWQGVCILLPVAVLAVVSLISLRQDERHAEADARNRAAESVQSLARAIGSSVDNELLLYPELQNGWANEMRNLSIAHADKDYSNPAYEAEVKKWNQDNPEFTLPALATAPVLLLADGRPIEPSDFLAIPEVPEWFLKLSPVQRDLWEKMRSHLQAEWVERDRQAFLASSPSAEACQAANHLTDTAETVISETRPLPSETGISFQDLACLRLLSATNASLNDSLLAAVRIQLVQAPSFISPKLLELTESLTNQTDVPTQLAVRYLRQYWDAQTRAAGFLDSVRQFPELKPWKSGWWSRWTPDQETLAVFQPMTSSNASLDLTNLTGPGYRAWPLPRAFVTSVFLKALRANKFFIPDYVATDLTVDGVPVESANTTGASRQLLLAGAEQTAPNFFAQNAIHFRVQFFLASRDQMLAAEQRRAHLFIALILGTVFTALAGLFVARRAFYRQLQLNEMKSNFVSSVSHELRAPIASVRLMAENLEGGKIPGASRQHEYFRFIVQECRRLSALIENVLDFSRIEQGRKLYEFEPTDLITLTRTTVKLMEPYAAEKGVNLRLEPVNDPSTFESMEADGRALQQALVNLIDNAVKHSPKGETVIVEINAQKNGGATGANAQTSFILLSVTDHGPGIPVAEQEKIFERFYRLGSELRRETQGVGIGLSVVKHIVEAHHGRIVVQSKPGHGSRFTIELPAT